MSKITIVKKIYGNGVRYEILYDGEYYEVGEGDLDAIQNGLTPQDLDLHPFDENDEPEVTFDDHRGDRWWHWGRVL